MQRINHQKILFIIAVAIFISAFTLLNKEKIITANAALPRDDGVSGASSADLLEANGFKLYGWDLEWEHHAKDGTPMQTVDEMVKKITTRLEEGNTFTKDHIVILIHDEMFQKKWEESELKQLIDELRKHENYVFEHIRYYPDK